MWHAKDVTHGHARVNPIMAQTVSIAHLRNAWLAPGAHAGASTGAAARSYEKQRRRGSYHGGWPVAQAACERENAHSARVDDRRRGDPDGARLQCHERR